MEMLILSDNIIVIPYNLEVHFRHYFMEFIRNVGKMFASKYINCDIQNSCSNTVVKNYVRSYRYNQVYDNIDYNTAIKKTKIVEL